MQNSNILKQINEADDLKIAPFHPYMHHMTGNSSRMATVEIILEGA
ncbi:hypothetical protein Asuc_1307 [Actinobacillus succinogenes 130Z]|uniref:Uncharacterized protein n=1 Tax=Actinobacillus succinogenes (strain ATCC 55618 / DSM 22257 / CCUG 43843 / 130Z) TaxID=339671 RepID=A6VNX0_ACTSZ|nr:hypothetical protein [Actinobacillus succinogenes]ABR74667.1 hypothetical protein Asuc_1307 [Actinobacillus succinogenes 130Z]